MREYCIFLGNGGHISKPPIELQCADDNEAAQAACQYIDGKEIEVWRGDYRVAAFPASDQKDW